MTGKGKAHTLPLSNAGEQTGAVRAQSDPVGGG